MKRPLIQVGIGVVAVFVAYYLVSFVPGTVTTVDPFTVLNARLVQFGLLAVVVFGVLSAVVTAVQTDEVESTGVFSTIDSRRRPDHVDTEWEVRQFGVAWEVLQGKMHDREGRSTYARGPLCPECGAELRERTETRRFRGDTHEWNCIECSFSQSRPEEFLHREKDVIETYVEREAPHGAKAQSPRSLGR